MAKTIVGLTEYIIFKTKEGKKKRVKAKVDTGAALCSLDSNLAKQLEKSKVIRKKLIKTAHGNKVRPIVNVSAKIKDRRFKSRFTLADRKHLTYKVLIGVNILKKNFLVDPSKK